MALARLVMHPTGTAAAVALFEQAALARRLLFPYACAIASGLLAKGTRMKIGLVQLEINLGDVGVNLQRAAAGARRARELGAELIVLPEFFTSGMALCPRILEVPQHQTETRSFLSALARELAVPIGGSFLTFDGIDAHNTFVLAFPDGSTRAHQKDLPTMVENAFYVSGNDDGVLETGIGRVGIALCWEMIRSQTVRRMIGKVDFVLAASCWWGHWLPYDDSVAEVQRRNEQLLINAPRDLARLLAVPVIHASCVGHFGAANLSHPQEVVRRRFLGHSQMVGHDGAPVAVFQPESGSGVLVCELPLAEPRHSPSATVYEYWIPTLTDAHLRAWERDARLGREYYETVALPRYRRLHGNQTTGGEGFYNAI
jgi:predicted amidohydrolase